MEREGVRKEARGVAYYWTASVARGGLYDCARDDGGREASIEVVRV